MSERYEVEEPYLAGAEDMMRRGWRVVSGDRTRVLCYCPSGEDADDIAAALSGEESTIEAVCKRYGYKRVMEIAAELWAAEDPIGALTVGPPVRQPKAFEKVGR